MEVTKFESDLYRLAFMEGSFYHLYMEFPQIKEGKTFHSFKALVREIAIIKLHSFLKARKMILEDLVEMKLESIDESLHPLWEPIFEQRDGIQLLRNKYLAHMQEMESAFWKNY